MSQFHAHQAVTRMNLREVAVATQFATLAEDLYFMSIANPAVEEEKLLARRADLCSAYGIAAPKQEKPFAFSNGIAIIPVHGSLINRFGSSYGSVTGYNFIRRQHALAVADEDVKAIVFDVNSNGGEAAGCFELCDELYAARGAKPSMSVIDSNCYSAAYALASSTGKIVLTPSGGAGSIGVVAMHLDVSKALDKFGVKVSFIKFGEHKVDGNPFEELSDEARKEIQANVNKSGKVFVETVARNRGLEASKVKATEARCYRADDALSLGLIDAIASPSSAMQAFLSELTGSVQQPGMEKAMAENTQPAANTAPPATQAQQPAVDVAAAANEARTAERARVQGILTCEEAKGKDKLAQHLAMGTDMSVDQAKAVLSAAGAEAAPAAAGANPFQAAMDRSDNPNVGAGSAGAGGEDPKVARILQAQYAATGLKLVK